MSTDADCVVEEMLGVIVERLPRFVSAVKLINDEFGFSEFGLPFGRAGRLPTGAVGEEKRNDADQKRSGWRRDLCSKGDPIAMNMGHRVSDRRHRTLPFRRAHTFVGPIRLLMNPANFSGCDGPDRLRAGTGDGMRALGADDI